MLFKTPMKYFSHYSCIENLIIFFAECYNKDYELMSLNTWNFKYTIIPQCERDASYKIGHYIETNGDTNFEVLEKLHGIKMKHYVNRNFDEILEHVKSETEAGRPVAIYSNTYWNHWDKMHYQKIRRGHYCLALKLDEDGAGIFIRDPHLAPNGTILPLEDFKKSFRDYFTLEQVEAVESYDWRILLSEALSLLSAERNMFEDMKSFSNEVLNGIDLKQEVKGYEETPFYAPIFQALYDLSKRRKQFSETLSYIAKKNNVYEFIKLSETMNLLGIRWASLYGFLSKAYYMNSDVRMLQKFSETILRAADEEELIFKKLLEICQSQAISESKSEISAEQIERDEEPWVYYFIDIKAYANNKAFGDPKDLGSNAELSTGGRFLSNEELGENSTWISENMSFRPLMYDSEWDQSFDNIECMGQEILIDNKAAKYVMVLGCSELGSHSESLFIEYMDGDSEIFKFEVSNWAEKVPLYCEKIIWNGKCMERDGQQVNELSNSAHLFGCKIRINSIKNINKITLPYCPNIHVFGVTLSI